MEDNRNLLVGFDRFIALEWANFALELALRDDLQRNQKIDELKSMLSLAIRGSDSVRKTANVLARLWFDSNPNALRLRSRAALLLLGSGWNQTVVFHWGMALITFPLFRQTTLQVGRALTLQGSFRQNEIHRRLAERYSNQGTIPRAADRIIQSLTDWEILVKAADGTYSAGRKIFLPEGLQGWLFEAKLLTMPSHRMSLDDLPRAPELFPFDLGTDHWTSGFGEGVFTLERDGTNLRYVILAGLGPT